MRNEQPEYFYVEPTTEIVGVLRGIQNAKARQVAVVLPDDARLFRNDVNLRLIASYAAKDEKDVVLITTDHAVARVADNHGLHVYESPEMAWLPEGRVIDLDITQPLGQLRVEARRKRYHALRAKRGYQRAVVIVLALLAVIGVWYASTPQVTVVVTPAAKFLEQEMSLPIAAPGVTDSGVPIYMLEVRVEANASKPATGKKTEGVSAAVGSVLLFNETDKQITVPAGTQVATDGGQIFLTQQAVTVPPLQAEYFMNVAVGMKAGQAEVAVRTQKPGSAGNVASGRIRLLPNGPSGLKVVNPEATHGGTDRSVNYVTAADIANAHKAASAKLKEKAAEAVLTRLGNDAYAYLALLTVKEGQVVPSAAIDQEETQVTVRLSGTATVPYLKKTDVLAQAAQLSKTLVPVGHEQQGAIQVQYIEEAEAETAVPATINIKARIPVVKALDADTIKRQVAGMETSLVATVLSELEDVDKAAVTGRTGKFLPRWTPWLQVVFGELVAPEAVDNVY